MLMNVYNDGYHFIGKPKCGQMTNVGKRGMQDPNKKVLRAAFRGAWYDANERGLKGTERMEFIQAGYMDNLDAVGYDGEERFLIYDETEYERFSKETALLLHQRKKRFSRKAALNEWNYFVTITYDDKKMDRVRFVASIRKTLSNFHTRYGWNYCAVFEEGGENGRTHLHALVYVPEGQMHGELYMRRQWSEKRHKNEYVQDHTYFHKRFGNCDFEYIDREDLPRVVKYLTKYMTKSNAGVIYSRGVPAEYEGVEIPEEGVFMFYKTSSGYLAILRDDLFAGIEIDSEQMKGFLDLGEQELTPFMEVFLGT